MPNYKPLYYFYGSVIPDGIISELESYKELPDGWDMGNGFAPSDVVINSAINIYKKASYYQLATEPTPLTSGGINLTLYRGDNFLDIYLYSDKYFDYKIEKGIGKPYKIIEKAKNILQSKIETIIVQTIFKWEPNLLEQYPLKNTNSARKDLTIPKLSNPTKGAFQYSNYPVSNLNPKLLVAI